MSLLVGAEPIWSKLGASGGAFLSLVHAAANQPATASKTTSLVRDMRPSPARVECGAGPGGANLPARPRERLIPRIAAQIPEPPLVVLGEIGTSLVVPGDIELEEPQRLVLVAEQGPHERLIV